MVAKVYDDFQKQADQWLGLDGTVKGFVPNPENPKAVGDARAAAINWYHAHRPGVVADTLSNDVLAQELRAGMLQARDDAVNYTVTNLEDILNETDRKSLEEKFLAIEPIKNKNPEHDAIVKLHEDYLKTVNLFRSYGSGEVNKADEKDLTFKAVEYAGKQQEKDLKARGYTKKDTLAAGIAAARAAAAISGPVGILSYGSQMLDAKKKEIDGKFTRSYSAVDYAKDNLRALVGKKPEDAIRLWRAL